MRKIITKLTNFLFVLFTIRASAQLNPINLVSYAETKGSIIYDVMPDRKGNIWLALHERPGNSPR